MGKGKMAYFHMGFAVLLVVIILILIRGTLRNTSTIVLPEMPADSSSAEGNTTENGLRVISVSPQTVQAAISTLDRPVAYQRQQTVETFWSGGSGKSGSQVSVSGEYTRIDTTMADGSVSHMLVSGDAVAVWYDEETVWTTLRSDHFTADIAQRMLTYESVLELPKSSIVEADYRDHNGEYCIYVATEEDPDGYVEQYWVSVETGLLVAAEKRYLGQLVYRFSSAQPETEEPESGLFLLPDGSTMES